MGLFDKFIKNVAGNIVDGAVRNVEYDASRKLSNAITGVASNVANKTKDFAEAKAAEVEHNIDKNAENFRDNAVVEKNTDTSERINFASKKEVRYNYKTEDGKYFSFEMNVVGTLTYQNKDSGTHVGDSHMASVISKAIFRALQDALTAHTIKGTSPEKLKEHMISLVQSVNHKIEDVCEQQGIHSHSLIITILKPTDEAMERYQRNMANGGQFETVTPSWTCEFCGTVSSGDVCEGCGADKH